jgi:hypothetical protein
MGNVVDFRKCESLDGRRQELTPAESERLAEILRAAGHPIVARG